MVKTCGKSAQRVDKTWRPSRSDAICGYALDLLVAMGPQVASAILRSARNDGEWWAADTHLVTLVATLRGFRLFKRQNSTWGLREPGITERAIRAGHI